MNTKHGFRKTALAALVAAAFCGSAWAADEVEPNSSLAEAQVFPIDASGTGTINGVINVGNPDIFKIYATGNQPVVIDIDGTDANTDTQVFVFDESGTAKDYMDDAEITDEGSEEFRDPYMTFNPPNTGVYYVAVTLYDVLGAGGVIEISPPIELSGAYTLNISGALTPPTTGDTTTGGTTGGDTTGGDTTGGDTTGGDTTGGTTGGDTTGGTTGGTSADVVPVAIDIFPGRRWFVRNQDWKRRDVIPVVILSSSTFDPRTIKQETLTFGSSGEEKSLRNCSRVFKYANRDRIPDLLCFFSMELTGFQPTSGRGHLRGVTESGTSFEGEAMLKVFPEKRKFGHTHGKGHSKHHGEDGNKHRGHR